MNFEFNKEMAYAVIGSIFGVVLVFVLYSTFFADIDESISATSLQQVESILPHGNKLETTPVTQYGAKTNRFTYPKVDPSTIGVNNFDGLVRSH